MLRAQDNDKGITPARPQASQGEPESAVSNYELSEVTRPGVTRRAPKDLKRSESRHDRAAQSTQDQGKLYTEDFTI